jgi:hypothetical protein
MADDVAVIDLAGVQLRNATNQARNSGSDTISPGWGYRTVITGMVQGHGGYFGAAYPNPTPLAQVLEDLSPGSSEFLDSEGYNIAGTLPFESVNQTFAGSYDAGLFTINYSATFSGGINAGGQAYFSITSVVLTPSILTGYLQFTSGNATITRIPATTADMNWDGQVNNFDIDPFVLALTNPSAYLAQDGRDPVDPGAVTRDGVLNNFDIDAFVAQLVH